MKYEIGDIIWVAKFEDNEQNLVDHHFFVVVTDDEELIPAEYFGFVISSNLSKSKENSRYKYNEPIKKNKNNKLLVDSIVKCDKLYKIPKETINYKLGSVDVEDMLRFLEAYNDFLRNKYITN